MQPILQNFNLSCFCLTNSSSIRFKLLLLFHQPPRTFPLASLPLSFQVHLLSSLPGGTQRAEWLRGPTWGDSGEPDVSDHLGTLALSTGAEDGEEIGEGAVFRRALSILLCLVSQSLSVCLDFFSTSLCFECKLMRADSDSAGSKAETL